MLLLTCKVITKEEIIMQNIIETTYDNIYYNLEGSAILEYFKSLSEDLKNNESIVECAAKKNHNVLNFVNNRFKTDKTLFLNLLDEVKVKFYPGYFFQVDAFAYFKDLYKNDYDLMNYMIQSSPCFIKIIDKNSENYIDLALKAYEKNTQVIMYLSDAFKNNREIAIKSLSDNANMYIYLSENLRRDKEIAKFALSKSGVAWEYIPKELKVDKNFILECLRAINDELWGFDKSIFSCIGENLRSDKEVVLEIFKHFDVVGLNYLSGDLRSDKEVVLAAINSNSMNLQYASEALKNDKEVVLAASNDYNNSLKYMGNALKNDKEFFKKLLAKDASFLEYAGNDIKNDKNIVLNLIKYGDRHTYGIIALLKNVGERLRDDKEIVLKSIEKNPENFVYVSDKLKDDKELVLATIKIDKCFFHYASNRLKDDKEVVLEAIDGYIYNLGDISDRLKEDEEVLKKIFSCYSLGECFEFLTARYKSNKDLALKAIKSNRENIKYALEYFINDKEFLLEAIKIDRICCVEALEKLNVKVENPEIALKLFDKNKDIFCNSYKVVSEQLFENKAFVLDLVKQSPYALEYVGEELSNDKEVVLSAINSDAKLIRFASKELRRDEGLQLEALKIDFDSFPYVNENIKDDKDIALKAVKKNPINYKYVSQRLKEDVDVIEETLRRTQGLLQEGKFDQIKNYIPDNIKENVTIMTKLIRINNRCIYLISSDLKKNKAFALDVLDFINPSNSRFISIFDENIKNDKEVALKAVTNRNFSLDALKYFKKFQGDKEVVLASVQSKGYSLKYASENLRNDKEVALAAVKNNTYSVEYVGKKLLEDADILYEIAKNNVGVDYLKIPEEVKDKIKKISDGILYPIIETASNWWAEEIKNPSFNIGENDEKAFWFNIISSINSSNQSKVTKESVKLFKEELAKIIKKKLKNNNDFTISVDYQPDSILQESAEKANLNGIDFPLKTTMWINKDKVSVRKGLGSPVVDLYNSNKIKNNSEFVYSVNLNDFNDNKFKPYIDENKVITNDDNEYPGSGEGRKKPGEGGMGSI